MPFSFRNLNQQRTIARSNRRIGQRLRPTVEHLEDRLVLATFVVDIATDVVNGNVAAGDVSLREAIDLANFTPGADTITFDAGLAHETITLGGSGLTLIPTESVTIDASALAGELTIDADNQSSIFFFNSPGEQLALRGLRLINGDTSFSGGTIFARGDLLLEDMTLAESSARYGGGLYIADGSTATITNSTLSENTAGRYGGGIYIADGASATITGSTISGNMSSRGGGIYSFGTVMIEGSTVSGNSAGRGGGVRNDGTMVIDSSTISSNIAGFGGGGVYNADGATVTIADSTIHDNRAERGGGLFNTPFSTVATISNSTLSFNRATQTGGGIENRRSVVIDSSTLSFNSSSQSGGGLINNDLNGLVQTTATITNSIIANSTGGDDVVNQGSLAGGFNLIGDGSHLSSFSDSIQGDPMLGGLGDNGGPTLTHLPSRYSPVINAGDPGAMPGVGDTPEFDQRGSGFPRVHEGQIDMGAVEAYPLPAQGLVVSTTSDVVDGNYLPGELSLREVVLLANNAPGADTITFDPTLSGSSIVLSGTHLELTGSVTINAATLTAGITIDADNQSRIFSFSSAGSLFALSGLTLINGNADVGGAILLDEGELRLEASALSGNSASLRGGGIYNADTTTITNSTLSGNTAGIGGGIYNSDTTTINNSTLAGNSAGIGGGIYNGDTTTINNSIVANSQGAADIASSATLNGAFNLVGDGSHSSSFADSIQGDPMLGPLSDNGGSSLSHLPMFGSPVIESGDPAAMAGIGGTPQFDQRGIGFARVRAGRIDIGAVETAPVLPAQGLKVSTNSDVLDGNFSPGELSLREAVVLANEVSGADTITFDSTLSGDTIMLAGTHLALTESVSIDAGALPSGITIDADHQSRILYFDAAGALFTLKKLTLSNGMAFAGGAIRVANGELRLEASTLSGNSATTSGGGVFIGRSATATIYDSTFIGNNALFGGGIQNTGAAMITSNAFSGNLADRGGGIHNSGTAEISTSTLTGNTAGIVGGGIYNRYQANATVDSSTLFGNSAGNDGGGLFNGWMTTISNSTLSGNSASDDGGGVSNLRYLAITNSTLTGNSADDEGGGIDNGRIGFYGTATITNSIVANNQGAADLSGVGVFTGAYNLIGDGSYLSSFADSIQGDPMLGPLFDNGGKTLTHLPARNSPVINAGDPAAMAGVADTPEFDQRGVDFPRVANDRLDIGAVELQSIAGPDFNDDGIINGIDIDLLQANIVIGPEDPILFDLSGDGMVTIADRDEWLSQAGAANLPSGNAYLLGDANLDGVVDGQDFVEWNEHKFSATPAWSHGDFNVDGVVDAIDFIEWNTNRFQSADASTNRPFIPQFAASQLAAEPNRQSFHDRWFAQLADDKAGHSQPFYEEDAADIDVAWAPYACRSPDLGLIASSTSTTNSD